MEEGDDIYLKDKETLSSQSIENNGFFTGDIGTIVDMESLKQEGPVNISAYLNCCTRKTVKTI
ncbi:hypothetical protein PO124_32085 [Bacillus licheniformis]|nr:hypothetical protein [Bacillus licheniformis]